MVFKGDFNHCLIGRNQFDLNGLWLDQCEVNIVNRLIICFVIDVGAAVKLVAVNPIS